MSDDLLDLEALARRVKDCVDLLQSEADALQRDTPVRARDPLAAQAIAAAAGMVEDDAAALVAEIRRMLAATGCADPDRREGHCCGIDDVEVAQ